MDAQDPRWAEIAQLQAKLLEGLAALPHLRNGSPELGPSTTPPPRASSLELADDRTPHYPVGNFGPESGLTPRQAWEANQLLAKADRERPIRGKNAQQRHARRVGGVISAVRNGRTGSATWGRSMLARKGGRAMALHGLHILRAMAPRGAEAARAARANKKAVAYWEKTGGEVLPLGQNERGEIPMQPSAAWQDRPFMMW